MRLVSEGGEEAASTRAVAAAAGVQAPTIYRLFGDKQGLLDAVAVHVFEAYVASKSAREPGMDPVDELRSGWDEHIAFGLDNPRVYELIYRQSRRGEMPAAAMVAAAVLDGHVRRIAQAGRLRVPEHRAAQLLHAAGSGTVRTLIATPQERRDPALSELAREAVISAITVEPQVHGPAGLIGAAVSLRASIGDADQLTAGEQALLRELLDRIAGS